jgi:hypothetical protein
MLCSLELSRRVTAPEPIEAEQPEYEDGVKPKEPPAPTEDMGVPDASARAATAKTENALEPV